MSTAKTVFVKSSNVVDTLILAAGKAAGTMYSKAKEAALLASMELDTALSLGEALALVMTAHADAFKVAGANVKSIFGDALTLYACPDMPVMVPAVDKNMSDISTAAKAVDLSKHVMRKAAQDVRKAKGLGRNTTPKADKPVVKAIVNDDAPFKALLSNVADALKNPELAARFIAFMGVAGYIVAPKVKVNTTYTTTANTPVKAPKPVKVTSMADLPSLKVTGFAAH